jgi:hypothetical protein
VTGPSEAVIAGVPQAAVAVAEPNAALISEPLGLQPKISVVPLAEIVGGFGAVAHVTVLDVVEVLPHASIAINVLVCVSLQLVDDTDPSLEVTVTAPHASVAVAVPSAALISEAVELQPSVKLVPFAAIVGGVRSEVQVTARDTVAVLPQTSVAVNILTWVLKHPSELIVPSLCDIVTAPHASVAVAEPSVASIFVGLQPRVSSV